jgi:hypothetical protein
VSQYCFHEILLAGSHWNRGMYLVDVDIGARFASSIGPPYAIVAGASSHPLPAPIEITWIKNPVNSRFFYEPNHSSNPSSRHDFATNKWSCLLNTKKKVTVVFGTLVILFCFSRQHVLHQDIHWQHVFACIFAHTCLVMNTVNIAPIRCNNM